MVCRLIADYHGREFHHYFSCSSQWLPSRSSVFGLTRQWTTVHIMLDNFYAGILFSLGGVSPMSWNFEDELDIGKRSMPQVYQFKRDLVYFLVGVSYSFTKRQIDSSSFVAITWSICLASSVATSEAKVCFISFLSTRQATPAALIFSGMAAFLDESLDPFAYVNSRRRKRAGAVAEWGTSFTRWWRQWCWWRWWWW